MRGLVLCVLLLVACEPESQPVHVLFVGLDGATWKAMDPLLESGHLPTIAALVAGGVRADLDCVPAHPQFPCFCPQVWTSIVTGQPYAVHGIGSIEDRSDQRRVPALWTLNGARGGVSTLVAMRGSWPVEEEVSWGLTEPGLDLASDEIYARWPALAPHPAFADPLGLTRPEALFEILGLLPARGERRPAWGVMARDRVSMQASFGLGLLSRFTSLLLGASELVMVTLHSPDKSEHVTWGSVEALPEGDIDAAALRDQADAWEGPVFGGLYSYGNVASQYLEADRWLGELLAWLDYDYVVLVSDHGMGRNAEPGGLPGLHGPGQPEAHSGILSITGPGVRAGVEVEATVLDVAPTLAYLMHLPVAENLPGRVLAEALEDDQLARHPVRSVPAW